MDKLFHNRETMSIDVVIGIIAERITPFLKLLTLNCEKDLDVLVL